MSKALVQCAAPHPALALFLFLFFGLERSQLAAYVLIRWLSLERLQQVLLGLHATASLLYICPHTGIYASSYYFGLHATASLLYVSSSSSLACMLQRHCYISVLILVYIRPRTTICVSSYYYMCVLILLYVCRRSRVLHCLHAVASYTNVQQRPHKSLSTSSSFACIYMSVYCYICVLILLHVCYICVLILHICVGILLYVSSYYCMYVLILQYI